MVSGEGDRALDVPGLDALGLRVDRVEVAEVVDHPVILAVLAGPGTEQHHVRVGQLPLAAEGADLAAEHPTPALRQPLGLP